MAKILAARCQHQICEVLKLFVKAFIISHFTLCNAAERSYHPRACKVFLSEQYSRKVHSVFHDKGFESLLRVFLLILLGKNAFYIHLNCMCSELVIQDALYLQACHWMVLFIPWDLGKA